MSNLATPQMFSKKPTHRWDESHSFPPRSGVGNDRCGSVVRGQAGRLGQAISQFCQDAINRIELNPELFPFVEGDVRRCLAKKFPFGILFRVETNLIEVSAVMHLHRDPDYWRTR